ncbi:hypothetical protein GCM10027346_20580 [Hymenobacter seoulensis]
MTKKSKVSTEKEEKNLFLSEATIENVNAVRKATVNFLQGLNIVIGRNGVGKTTFFNSIYNLLNRDAESTFNVNANFVFKGSSEISVDYQKQAKKILLDPLIDVRQSVSKVTVKYNKKRYKGLREFFNDLEVEGPYTLIFVRHGVPMDHLMVFNEPFNFEFDKDGESDELGLLGYSGHNNRAFPYFVCSLMRSLDVSISAMDNLISTDINYNERVRISLGNALAPVLIRFNEILPKYSPIKGVRLSNSINIHVDEDKKSTSVSNIFLEYNVNGNWLPFNSLSDGTKRVFYIIAELTTPYMELARPTSDGEFEFFSRESARISIVEEPELGIHPHQFHDLLNFIKEESKKQQIIITTHSPQSLDILEKDELDRLLICTFDRDEGTVFKRLNDEERIKALMYMDEVHLSEYWRVSDLEKSPD